MKVQTTKKKNSYEFKVTYDQNDFEPARLRALERLARGIKIPGFRKGRAPANVVEQYVNPNELANTMLDTLVRQSIPKIIEDAGIEPISMPHVDVMKHVPGDTAEIVIKIDAMPEVKLPDYHKLKAKYLEPKIAENDVDDVLGRIAEGYAETKVVKRSAEKGDQVIIDFKGLKDGKAFDGGSAKDYQLALGSNMFIPGFEEGIIGHSTGDKFDLKLTFPKDYGAKHLAGQKVIFEVLVKQINEVKTPKIDDALAKKIGLKDLKELRDNVRKDLLAQQHEMAERRYVDTLLEDLITRSKTELPETLLDDQTTRMREEMKQRIESTKRTLDDYLAENKLTPEAYAKQLRQMAEQRVKGEIVLRKIADELKIKVKDDEVEQRAEEFEQNATKDGTKLSDADKARLRANLRHDIRMDKTIQALRKLNQPTK